MIIVTQIVEKVKQAIEGLKSRCKVEDCNEPQFRASGLCFDHFIEEELWAWAAWDSERQTVLESIGYLWGDSWDGGMVI